MRSAQPAAVSLPLIRSHDAQQEGGCDPWVTLAAVCRQPLLCTHRGTGETGSGRRITTTLFCPPSGGGILKQNVCISHLHLDTCHLAGIEMSAALRHVLLTESYATSEGKISPGAGFAAIFLPLEIPLDIAWQLVLPKCISSSCLLAP